MTEIKTGQIRIIIPSTRPGLRAGRFEITADDFTIRGRGIRVTNRRWGLTFKGDVARPLTVTRKAGPVDTAYTLALLC